jgi:DNA-binding response OmpR family regulator
MRRSGGAGAAPLSLGAASLYPLSRELTVGGTPFDLPPRERSLLEVLLRARRARW